MGHSTLDQLILHNFPQTGLSLAFGYGSRVIRQGGSVSNNDDLVDLIFVVDDTNQWHSENLSRNNQHYSGLKYLWDNANTITRIQENHGAKMYFNPYVEIGNISIKYGVIKTNHLIDDLTNWEHLYAAGRLHKPVELLVKTFDNNDKLKAALRFNKENAIRAALLQLPENFDTIQLYKVITGLSYHGDLRMIFSEDKNKIDNIVLNQVDRFDQLYIPVMRMSHTFKDNVHWHEGKRSFTQNVSHSNIYANLMSLPLNLRRTICDIYSRDARSVECEVILSSLSRNIQCDKIVAGAIAAIIRKSSLTQSLKGLVTAGLLKSLRYSQRKLYKSFVSRV